MTPEGGALIRKGGTKLQQKKTFSYFSYANLNLPNLFRTYLPKNPVAPNTVATTPLKDDLPPGPAFGK